MAIPEFSEPDHHSGLLKSPRKSGFKILILPGIILCLAFVLWVIFSPEEEVELPATQQRQDVEQIMRIQKEGTGQTANPGRPSAEDAPQA
jgi:type II secretory pathway component PulM